MNEFLKLVREMRMWQVRYFRTRSQEALENAKDLEGRVDAYIADKLLSPTLFN